MSEKFPALDNDSANDLIGADETDFLKREAEVLGDEFKTEADDIATTGTPVDDEATGNDEEDEFNAMTTNTDNNSNNNTDDLLSDDNSNINKNADTTVNEGSLLVNQDADKIIQNWKESRDKEITERDERETKEKKELQNDAIEYIDAFYESYNKKKEDKANTTKKEAEDFLKERDQFFQQDNTTWDRALQLINEDDAAVVGGRDRSKFMEILQRLKGNANAPGA